MKGNGMRWRPEDVPRLSCGCWHESDCRHVLAAAIAESDLDVVRTTLDDGTVIAFTLPQALKGAEVEYIEVVW